MKINYTIKKLKIEIPCVVHCPTEEDARNLFSVLKGYKFSVHLCTKTKENNWSAHKQESVYFIEKDTKQKTNSI